MGEARTQQGIGSREERNLGFDVLNVLSCLAVIALHHNSLVHSFNRTPGWIQSLVVECLCYCGVPIFLMISGATLMKYRDKYDTVTFFKKRIMRVGIPWFFWSIFYLIWKLETGQMTMEPFSIRIVFDQIFNFKVLDIFWYFGTLFACYFSLPVVSLLQEHRKILWYIVLLNFFFLSFLPALRTWLGFSWGLDVPEVGSLIIFMILGYLLTTGELEKWQCILLYIAGFLCVAFRFGYTLYFSYLRGVTDTSIKSYSYFHAVIYAAAVFVLGCRIHWEKILPAWLKSRMAGLSACSFGIYLIHWAVMYYERQWLALDNNWVWRSVCILLTYFISLLIVALLRKIPILRRLVG